MVSTRSETAGLTPRPAKSQDADKSNTSDIVIPLPSSRGGAPASSSSATTQQPWSYRPSPTILLWLAVSLPLVAWDTGYVLGRPHTMPGGKWHRPLWVPYDLYGRVDHVYGFKSWDAGLGFTGAQGALNLIESLMYVGYWALWYRNKDATTGRVAGRAGGQAVALGFAAAVMTFSKTVLYWLCEYYSGFDNIGHNSWDALVFLWIIPNGAWLVFPCYMIYELGLEIVDSLARSSAPANVKAE